MADKRPDWNHGPVPEEVTPEIHKHAKATMPEDQWRSYKEHFDAGLADYKSKEEAKAAKAEAKAAEEAQAPAKEAKSEKK